MRALAVVFALMVLSAGPSALAVPSSGDAAPQFKLRAPDGALIRLDEIAYPGKSKPWADKRPILIDFFRTDCSPCRRAIPELIKIHETYKERGLEVLLIALLEEKDGRKKLDEYMKKHSLPFNVAIDETEHFSKKYLGKTVKLPSTFLIDRNGVIRQVKHGGAGSLVESFSKSIDTLVGPPADSIQPASRTIGGRP